jgi:hypothetical protein
MIPRYRSMCHLDIIFRKTSKGIKRLSFF